MIPPNNRSSPPPSATWLPINQFFLLFSSRVFVGHAKTGSILMYVKTNFLLFFRRMASCLTVIHKGTGVIIYMNVCGFNINSGTPGEIPNLVYILL